MTSARRARRMSASIRPRSTAAVDSRSSQNAIGRSVNFSKLRAKARVDCARGPSEPSMLIGRPRTKPTAARSLASASRRLASAVKFLRATVSTPVASLRSGSLTATPMVLVPRSSPISAPRAGRCGAISSSGPVAILILLLIQSAVPPPGGLYRIGGRHRKAAHAPCARRQSIYHSAWRRGRSFGAAGSKPANGARYFAT